MPHRPVEGQFERALKHTGEKTMQMRRELATAVVKLFDSRRGEPRPLSPDERERISRIVKLVVKLRAAVDRDRGSREIEVIFMGPRAKRGLASRWNGCSLGSTRLELNERRRLRLSRRSRWIAHHPFGGRPMNT